VWPKGHRSKEDLAQGQGYQKKMPLKVIEIKMRLKVIGIKIGSKYQNKDAAQGYLFKEPIKSLLNKDGDLCHLIKETTQRRLTERQGKIVLLHKGWILLCKLNKWVMM
jgi:hypothetical protein